MNRKLSALALAILLAKPAESLYHYAYYDPPRVLTVCWGSTKNVVKNRYYSTEECEGRINAEMQEAIDQVERCVPGLPEKPLAAFADAVFNMGPTIVCNPEKSTAARYLNETPRRITDACNQLPRWDKAKVAGVYVSLPGLKKRRLAERELCLAK